MRRRLDELKQRSQRQSGAPPSAERCAG
jgi:hypothetical protein